MPRIALAIYEKAIPPTLAWRQKLDAAAEAGFDEMELSCDETDEKLARLEMPRGLQRAVLGFERDAGVRINSICLSGHRKYPLGSLDAATRQRGMEIMRGAVRFAETMGIRIIQLAGYDVYYEESTPDTIAYFENNLWTSVEYAASHGVILAFETMETPFMNTTEKAMNYVTRVGSPYLGVYPDIGNLTNGVEPEEGAEPGLLARLVRADLEKGRGHIFAAHLKETRKGIFRDLLPGDGRVDYKSAYDALIRLGVRRFTAEQWYHDDRVEVWKSDLSRTAAFIRGLAEQ